jgi:hypothetical protein
MGEERVGYSPTSPFKIIIKGDDQMKYAVLVNENYYLLTKDGANYATFSTREEAENLALDFSDMDAEVIAI